jgi:DNA repair exonuclease SbcCD ATPase subunit
MNKKYWIIGLSIVVGTVLLYFLLHEPKPTDSHKDDHADIIATNDTLKAHDIVYDKIIDSLKKDNDQLKTANKSLITGQAQTERKLNAKAYEVKTLVAQIREINQDTGFFGHLLDSLQGQVESLSFLLVQYEQYADSINSVNAAQQGNYEAIILEKDKRYNELKGAYDKLLTAYKELFNDYAKNQKSVRRERLKTKIAAILAMVAGAAAVLK